MLLKAQQWVATVFVFTVAMNCISLATAQTATAAKLIQATGQVSVLRGNATWALNLGDSIQPQQIIVTGADGSAIFQVADGSKFEVFPNSKAVFRNSPGDWRDLLDVVIGRVRVEIEKFGGQPNPNKVRTATAVISVRGTIFDVTVEDDDGTTLVLVEEGQVEVKHQLQPGEAKMLNPGEWVEVFKNQALAVRKTDHGAILQRVARATSDALYEILMRSRAGTTGTSGGGTTSSIPADTNGGKTGSTTPTPPPAPPPPPPPQ